MLNSWSLTAGKIANISGNYFTLEVLSSSRIESWLDDYSKAYFVALNLPWFTLLYFIFDPNNAKIFELDIVPWFNSTEQYILWLSFCVVQFIIQQMCPLQISATVSFAINLVPFLSILVLNIMIYRKGESSSHTIAYHCLCYNYDCNGDIFSTTTILQWRKEGKVFLSPSRGSREDSMWYFFNWLGIIYSCLYLHSSIIINSPSLHRHLFPILS